MMTMTMMSARAHGFENSQWQVPSLGGGTGLQDIVAKEGIHLKAWQRKSWSGTSGTHRFMAFHGWPVPEKLASSTNIDVASPRMSKSCDATEVGDTWYPYREKRVSPRLFVLWIGQSWRPRVTWDEVELNGMQLNVVRELVDVENMLKHV